MNYEEVKSIEERAIYCLNYCKGRGLMNCPECEHKVNLEEVIELCNEALTSWLD